MRKLKSRVMQKRLFAWNSLQLFATKNLHVGFVRKRQIRVICQDLICKMLPMSRAWQKLLFCKHWLWYLFVSKFIERSLKTRSVNSRSRLNRITLFDGISKDFLLRSLGIINVAAHQTCTRRLVILVLNKTASETPLAFFQTCYKQICVQPKTQVGGYINKVNSSFFDRNKRRNIHKNLFCILQRAI